MGACSLGSSPRSRLALVVLELLPCGEAAGESRALPRSSRCSPKAASRDSVGLLSPTAWGRALEPRAAEPSCGIPCMVSLVSLAGGGEDGPYLALANPVLFRRLG